MITKNVDNDKIRPGQTKSSRNVKIQNKFWELIAGDQIQDFMYAKYMFYTKTESA